MPKSDIIKAIQNQIKEAQQKREFYELEIKMLDNAIVTFNQAIDKLTTLGLTTVAIVSKKPRKCTDKRALESGRTDKPEVAKKRTRVVDRQGVAKVIEFVSARTRPTSTSAIAKRFNIARTAAGQRLQRAVQLGLLERVKRGYYRKPDASAK